MLMYFLGARCFSTAVKTQSPLAILRRKTGYPISKCKDALTKYNNDITSAETYLQEQAQKEGWIKAEKLQGRVTRQGLIGSIVRENKGVMVEVNCETDFVSKNKEFQHFVAQIIETSFEQMKKHTLGSTFQQLSSSAITAFGPMGNKHTTLGDFVAENIGHFGENISLSRGWLMSSNDGILSSYVYNSVKIPDSDVAMGTYASFVHLRPNRGTDFSNEEEVRALGVKIGQHIVGMNPTCVMKSEAASGEEEALMDQNYLLDNNVTMKEWLASHDIHVTDFVRFALSENKD